MTEKMKRTKVRLCDDAERLYDEAGAELRANGYTRRYASLFYRAACTAALELRVVSRRQQES